MEEIQISASSLNKFVGRYKQAQSPVGPVVAQAHGRLPKGSSPGIVSTNHLFSPRERIFAFVGWRPSELVWGPFLLGWRPLLLSVFFLSILSFFSSLPVFFKPFSFSF